MRVRVRVRVRLRIRVRLRVRVGVRVRVRVRRGDRTLGVVAVEGELERQIAQALIEPPLQPGSADEEGVWLGLGLGFSLRLVEGE